MNDAEFEQYESSLIQQMKDRTDVVVDEAQKHHMSFSWYVFKHPERKEWIEEGFAEFMQELNERMIRNGR